MVGVPARAIGWVGRHGVRLTAPDGYQAERSYSIGSAPGGDTIELVIERLEDGEVSLFFHEVVEVGDAVEIRAENVHGVVALKGIAALSGDGEAERGLGELVAQAWEVKPEVELDGVGHPPRSGRMKK